VRVRRFLALLLWVPAATILGPVIALRHGFPQVFGGAVAMSIPWVTAYLWVKLDGRSGRPRRAGQLRLWAALAVGMALTLGSYGHADRLYQRLFTYPREVVVVAARCAPAKVGCVYHDELATPDGHRLPLDMYDIVDGDRVGQAVTVRWDELGYASPVSTTYPRDTQPNDDLAPVVPAGVFAAVGALYAGLTAYFALPEFRRRRRPG
jgi:hypothetical protein